MALAAQIVYTVQDDSGERGTTSINVPITFNLSDYGEFASGMGTLLDALLSGRLVDAEICFGVDLSGLINNLLGGSSDVEEIGAFQFRTADNLPVSVNIPGIDEGFQAAGSDDLDQSAPGVAAFITAMETGIVVTGGTIIPCDVGEVDIINVEYARERFRASGSKG